MTGDEIKKIETELSVVESEMDKLNEWEATFVESIRDQFSRTGTLSIRQIGKLHALYEKVV